MRKKKVFLLIPSLTKGGAERVIAILSNSLNERGYSIFLIFLNKSEHAYTLAPQINVIYLNTAPRSKNILNRISLMWNTFSKLVALIKNEKPDFLISFITSANIWSGIVGNLLGVPYFVSERNTPDKTVNRLNPAMRKIVFQLYKRAKVIVAPSLGIIDNLKASKNFKGLSNTVVINNPVTGFPSSSATKVHHRKFILAVGRLHPAKGFDLLIEAFNKLNLPETDLIIAGKGNEKQNLETLINNYHLSDRVFLVGTKDNIHDYYRQCELFVLSSRNEGYPNVLIEAMSSGAPCIAFNCNYGPSEIINNKVNGVLVPAENVDLLAEAIAELSSNQILREKYSREALKIAEVNSTNRIVDQWEKLILNYA